MKRIKKNTKKIIQKVSQGDLRKKIRKQTNTYLLAALGFVAGLAWNEAMKSAISLIFPLNNNDVIAKFAYAIFITALVVFMAVHVPKDENEK